MGHETVGRIAALGDGVRAGPELAPGRTATVNPVIGCGSCAACRAGDEQLCARRRVIGVDPARSAAFAELMLAPAANVVVLPDELPEEHGALIEPLAVGYHAATRGQVGQGDGVLVLGGGPIGQACALAARRLEAGAVLVSEPTPSRRALLARLGFGTVDPRAGILAEQVAAVLGGPASVVLDAVGSSTTIGDALSASAFGGQIVLVGMNSPELTLGAYQVSTFERSIVGSFAYRSGEFLRTADWVASGPPGLEHLIEGRVGLDGAPDAFRRLAAGELDASKVLVHPGRALT
jgi:threonine dehydrogenase-like Zn-dependent dehydrogenase